MDLIDLAIWGQLVAGGKDVETRQYLWLWQLAQIELYQIMDEQLAAGLEDFDAVPSFPEERITVEYFFKIIATLLLHVVIVLSCLILNRFRLKEVVECLARSKIFFGNETWICQSDQTDANLTKASEKFICKLFCYEHFLILGIPLLFHEFFEILMELLEKEAIVFCIF